MANVDEEGRAGPSRSGRERPPHRPGDTVTAAPDGAPAGAPAPAGWLDRVAGLPDAVAAFPRRTRQAWAAWAAATVALAALAGTAVRTPTDYLVAFAVLPVLISIPALGACIVAARRARPAGEVGFWGWWAAGVAAMVAIGAAVGLVAEQDVAGLRGLSLAAVALATSVFTVPHVRIMRRRSGRRSVALDVVEVAIATSIACALLSAVLGGPLLRSRMSWFTFPCAFAVVTGFVGVVWITRLFGRVPRHHRRLELLGIVLSALATADAGAQLAQGLSEFTGPAVPALALHQLTFGALLLIPLHAGTVPAPGLERLSPQRQVRGSRSLTLITIAAVPPIALAAADVGEPPWVVQLRVAGIALLVVLLALRALLALDETKRLYAEVAASAEERQALLHAVTRNLDDERHRVAAQLHQQAISSYAAFASFLDLADPASPSSGAALPETSRRLRADLGRTAETWRRFMLAVAPAEASPRATAASLTVSIRAYVTGLFGDGPVPPLTVDVHPDLRLDWATEALVLRVLQEGLARARRRGGPGAVHVAVAPEGPRLRVCLGTGEAGGSRAAGGDLDDLRALVAVVDGTVAVEQAGTACPVIVADLGVLGARASAAPHLRVVRHA